MYGHHSSHYDYMVLFSVFQAKVFLHKRTTNKMSSQLVLFLGIPAGTIEVLFDVQNQPRFKRADLEKYLGIRNKRNNFKDLNRYFIARKYIIGWEDTPL